MPDPSLLPLLHLTDTAFPAGGYAHSFGLETYCQDGRVTDADSLAAFLTMQLEGAAGPCDATPAGAARRPVIARGLGRRLLLDAPLPAVKPGRGVPGGEPA